MSVDLLQSVARFLRDDEVLAELVGPRVYTDQLPQGADSTAIVLWTIFENRWTHLLGQTGRATATVQINSYGLSRKESNTIAERVNNLLDGYQGTMLGTQIGGCTTDSGGIIHGTDRPAAGSDRYRFVATEDFQFHYQTAKEVDQ